MSCEGEPVRISVCHCHACQKRTGSAFGAQARFPREKVAIRGASSVYTRTGDSGGKIDFHFCASCGSTVFYAIDQMPDVVAVPIGAFADRDFPEPRVVVYETRRHAWVKIETTNELEVYD